MVKPLVILKFGGTSLADRDRIRQVAEIVLRKCSRGHSVVVVVSARARQTDAFIAEALSLSPRPSARETDMLLSSGERISAALLSIALNEMGCKAIALSGSQAGIITDDNHTNARIIEVRPYRVLEAIKQDCVAVVGGFQGVSFNKEITTLGRGGSDVTAVALASALGADLCEIYSDVDGVFSADPNVVPDAVRIDELSYQEMHELGESGARVLHPGSVEFAKIRDTIIHAKCTWSPQGAGSIIRNLEGRIKPRLVGVVSEEKIVLVQVADRNGDPLEQLTALLQMLDKEGVKTKQFSFDSRGPGEFGGTVVVPQKENYHLDAVLGRLPTEFGPHIRVERDFSTVSLIGTGITDRYEYLLQTLSLLADARITVAGLHTSSFRISILTARQRLAEAVRLLHRRFIEQASTTV